MIAALYLGRVILIPFAMALLFSLVLSPVVSVLERTKIPRILAILLVVLTLSALAASAGWIASARSSISPTICPTTFKHSKTSCTPRPPCRPRAWAVSNTLKQLGHDVIAAIPGSAIDESKGSKRPMAPRSPGL
jgi:hypothetical protein